MIVVRVVRVLLYIACWSSCVLDIFGIYVFIEIAKCNRDRNLNHSASIQTFMTLSLFIDALPEQWIVFCIIAITTYYQQPHDFKVDIYIGDSGGDEHLLCNDAECLKQQFLELRSVRRLQQKEKMFLVLVRIQKLHYCGGISSLSPQMFKAHFVIRIGTIGTIINQQAARLTDTRLWRHEIQYLILKCFEVCCEQ